MKSVLLSIDWDYFMPYVRNFKCSLRENRRNAIKNWYKLYFDDKDEGIDVVKKLRIGNIINGFVSKLKSRFNISPQTKIIITESHKEAYEIAEESGLKEVYSFDSHSDLGYEGVKSLDFEVNCANWLGKLLKDHLIYYAGIVYSPYTIERPGDFEEINNTFHVRYYTWNSIPKEESVPIIHICRSGPWTAPWLDNKFSNFIKEFKLKYKFFKCPERKWIPEKLNLSQRIDCMMNY